MEEMSEYAVGHKKDQELFLNDLKQLLEKHKRVLYEEQYYGVVNESVLSKSVINEEWLEWYTSKIKSDLDLYTLLCFISDSMDMPIPDSFYPPKGYE